MENYFPQKPISKYFFKNLHFSMVLTNMYRKKKKNHYVGKSLIKAKNRTKALWKLLNFQQVLSELPDGGGHQERPSSLLSFSTLGKGGWWEHRSGQRGGEGMKESGWRGAEHAWFLTKGFLEVSDNFFKLCFFIFNNQHEIYILKN